MGYKKYSDAQVAEALIRLAVNKYDYALTSDQVDVPIRTLRRWDKDVPKKGVSDLLERAIQRLLMAIPNDMSGHTWGVTLGILLDKWLLLHGEPTSRTEGIFRKVEGLTSDDRTAVLEEAERILAGVAGGGIIEGGNNN